MINIDEINIKEAMDFYEISDNVYLKNCYDCIEILNKSIDFRLKTSKVYDILYGYDNEKISDLWNINNINELFGKSNHPYITSVILLSGYKIHADNMKKYNFSKKQISIHKKRVKEALCSDIYDRKYKGIRVSQMLWGIYFVNVKLIEVGVLQYELYDEEHKIIKIHIPRGINLSIENAKKSITIANKEIKKYFKLQNLEFICNSWLLSKQIRQLVSNTSNIANFYNLFFIKQGENCIEDILNFVYNLKECQDYKILSENTSLQKNIKKYLIEGNDINLGLGVIKVKV
jgi:hypothetical protein